MSDGKCQNVELTTKSVNLALASTVTTKYTKKKNILKNLMDLFGERICT